MSEQQGTRRPHGPRRAPRRRPGLRLLRGLWYAAAGGVVAVAVAVSLARLLVPIAGRYQAELEAWASRGAGMPVRMARVEAAWRGLHPQIVLEGVRVLDPATGQPWLEVRRLRVALDLWRSLRAGGLRPARIEAEGTALAVARDAAGRVRVLGLRARGERRGPAGALIGRLLAIARGGVVLRDLRLVYQAPGVPPVLLDETSVRLVVRAGRVELAAATRLPAALGERLRLAARLPLETAAAGSPDGTYHLAVEGLRLDHPLVRGWLPREVRLEGAAHLTLWAELAGRRLVRLAGRGELTRFRLGLGDRPPLEAARAWGRFDWHRTGQGWRLVVADFQRLGRPGLAPLPAAFAVAVRRGADGHVAAVRAAARHLRVEDAAVVAAAVLGPGARERLTRAAPRGLLRRLRLVVRPDAPPDRRLGLEAEVEDLAVAPEGRRPGVEGLDLRLQATETAARLVLAARGVTLRLPKVFRGPLRAERLEGLVLLRRTPQGWRAFSPGLHVSNADLEATVRGVVAGGVPARRDNVRVDLAAAFAVRDAGPVPAYLPVAVIPAPVVGWLDRAVRGGRAPEGRFLLRGPMARFPFRGGEGRFLVRFRLEEGTLDYASGWPRLQAARGELAFSQASLSARVESARLLGARVEGLRIAIPDMGRGAVLELSGHVHGTLADGIALLRRTGIAGPGYTRWLGRVEGAGSMALDISLALPLGRHHRDRRPRYRGTVRVRGGTLRDLGRGIAVTRLGGEVTFEPRGLTAERLAGRLLGRPVTVRLRPDPGAGGTRLTATARLPVHTLGRLAGRPLPSFLGGGAAWRLEALLPRAGAGRPVELELRSDLRGVGVSLPAPLGKPPGEAAPSWLRLSLRNGTPAALAFRYGKRLAGRVRDPEGRAAGALRLGGRVPARAPAEPGLVLTGRAEVLDLDGWRAWLARAAAATSPAGVAAPGGAAGPVLREVAVGAARVRLLGRDWPDLTLAGTRAPDGGWDLTLRSPRLAGSVRLPGRAGGTVRARLERLHLPAAEAEGTGARKGGGIGPRSLPPLDLVVAALRLGARDLGRWEVLTATTEGGLAIRRLAVDSRALKVRGEGGWLERGGRERATFQGTVESDDLAAAMALLGYAGGLSARHARVDLDVSWTGPPWDIALDRLQGRLHLRLVKGRLSEVEPGAGRLFGLLSLSALPRRLSLDFSDLFGKGLAFDWIEGDFTLEAGDAYTHNLTLEGPSARIEIAGRIGLARRDYDQHVRVTPHVSGGLPLAGALLGGPAVGAAILLFQRIVNDPLSGLARYEYRLTGSWDRPRVERIEGARSGEAPAPEAAEAP